MGDDSNKVPIQKKIGYAVAVVVMAICFIIFTAVVFFIFWAIWGVPVAIVSTIILYGLIYFLYQAAS